LENKARYTLVGLFLIIFTVALVTFVLWLARYDLEEIQAKEYRIYSESSVMGLNKNSIIQYKGLDIGTIDDIRIISKNLEQVEIILKITKPDLIKTDSYAIIQSQGVTGNKYIEIDGGTQSSQLLKPNNEGIAIIPLKKSFLDKLTNSADNISVQIETMLKRFDKLLDKENLENIKESLKNLNNSSKDFNQTVNKVNNLIDKSIIQTVDNVNNMSKSIDKVVKEDITKTLNDFDKLSLEIKNVINEDVKVLLKDLKQTAKSSKDVDKVLDSLENTLQKIDDTVDNFNNNGGNMIFNTREVPYGPGEKK
jgi:phospholipid/cholesterol/gamma-HCH transport system substrate-binding protein